MATVNILATNILQNIFFFFNRRKKLVQVWNVDVSKWQNFTFGVNDAFKADRNHHN